jgi:hypothetical protein
VEVLEKQVVVQVVAGVLLVAVAEEEHVLGYVIMMAVPLPVKGLL